jgi:hypothetical protein
MKQHPRPFPLRIALLALGLLAGATLQAPAHAAAGLGQFTRGVLAPADITGGVIFGKNGEVIPLDARGKPLKPCVMSRAGQSPSASKKTSLPECQRGDDAKETDEDKPRGSGVPCAGFYIIYVGGYPVKVWYPAGCTPP